MNFSSNKIYILLFLFFGFVVVLFFLDPFSSYYEKFEGSIVDGVQYNIFGSPCTINQLAIDARQVENGEPIKYGCAPPPAPAPTTPAPTTPAPTTPAPTTPAPAPAPTTPAPIKHVFVPPKEPVPAPQSTNPQYSSLDDLNTIPNYFYLV